MTKQKAHDLVGKLRANFFDLVNMTNGAGHLKLSGTTIPVRVTDIKTGTNPGGEIETALMVEVVGAIGHDPWKQILTDTDWMDGLRPRVMTGQDRAYISYDVVSTAEATRRRAFTIEKVIFNAPATIVIWADGTKTVVKCQNDEEFDPEKGLAMAIAKRAFGNEGSYFNQIKKWTEPYYEDQKEVEQLMAGFKEIAKNLREIGELFKNANE